MTYISTSKAHMYLSEQVIFAFTFVTTDADKYHLYQDCNWTSTAAGLQIFAPLLFCISKLYVQLVTMKWPVYDINDVKATYL